ncbi:MAG: hypothetical protein H6723_14650 [Sandaracinus sp.]|nr:hypothetical protein [Sandaracinus sp.]
MRSDDLQSRERLRWEDECLARAKRGERAAFGELYREYAPAIFARVLLPKLGNRPAAEDALAETFRVALERLHQYESRGVSFYFWLVRIAANKATDMHRVKQRTGRALSSLESLLGPLADAPDGPGKQLEDATELARCGNVWRPASTPSIPATAKRSSFASSTSVSAKTAPICSR